MLGYLGTRRSEWPAQLRAKRQLYDQFIDEMVIPPGSAGAAAAAAARQHSSTTSHSSDEHDDDNDDDEHSAASATSARTTAANDQHAGDHPLSDGPDSAWGTYFKDNEVLLQIDRDVRRLCPDMSFFQQPTEHPCRTIVDGDGRRLHARVQPSVLNSANVERKGLGQTKVLVGWLVVVCISAKFGRFLTHPLS